MLTSGVPYAGHGIGGEEFKDWVILNVGCQYDDVSLSVKSEGVALPASNCFDDVEREALEQVFKGGSNSEAMAF